MMIVDKIDTNTLVRVQDPVADEYARRLVTEARQWMNFGKSNSNLGMTRLHSMSLEALSFSCRYRTNSLAIPTKLVGTRALQDTLEAISASNHAPWPKLELMPSNGRIEAYYDGVFLGWLWPGHVWVWPLLSLGIGLRLIAVTGTDADWKWLGANVVLTNVIAAIEALQTGLSHGPADPSMKQTGTL